jgi:hypothetical protein
MPRRQLSNGHESRRATVSRSETQPDWMSMKKATAIVALLAAAIAIALALRYLAANLPWAALGYFLAP